VFPPLFSITCVFCVYVWNVLSVCPMYLLGHTVIFVHFLFCTQDLISGVICFVGNFYTSLF
jgi:hypothetical protein